MKQQHTFPNCRQTHPFTLVEMLAVIAIMLVLFGVAVAPFGKLMGASGVDGAARMIGGQLRLARQHAISQRKHVAVLMPDESDGPDKYRGTAFRPCIVEVSGSAALFKQWIPDTKWNSLPKGAIIENAAPESSGSVQVTFSEEPYSDANNNGGRDSGEPYFDVNGNGSYDASPSGDAAKIRAIVFKSTGKLGGGGMNGSTYRVRVSEGVYAGDPAGFDVRNADNAIELQLDVYTGRVSYD